MNFLKVFDKVLGLKLLIPWADRAEKKLNGFTKLAFIIVIMLAASHHITYAQSVNTSSHSM